MRALQGRGHVRIPVALGLVLCLAACGSGDEGQEIWAPPVSLEVGTASPGDALTVTVQGLPAGFQVAGGVALSTSGACEVRLLGLCSELAQPALVAAGTTVGTTATVQLLLPSTVPLGATLSVQLAGRRGATRALGPLLQVTVQAPPDCGPAQDVVDAHCTGCHGAAGVAGLDLRQLADVVGLASTQAPLSLVAPGDVAGSYLLHKAAGTHLAVGGGGSAMPPAGPLDATSLQRLTSWVGAGAACDARETPSAFTCDPAAAPSATPMRRLSRLQYELALEDAIERLGGWQIHQALGGVWRLLSTLPEDHADRTLSREDQAVSQEHVEAWYRTAEGIADAFVSLPLPCGSAACVPDFVSTVGGRIHRRPFSPEELDFYLTDVYGAAVSHSDGMRDLVLVWLASPGFTYQIEHGDPTVLTGDPDTVALTAHELASRLSLHAWSGPADDELWSLAESGALLDPVVYEAQVVRLFDDPRSQTSREQFFVDWLQLHDIPQVSSQVGRPGFDAFRGSIDPAWDLPDRLRDDALDLLDWHVRSGSSLDEVWTEPLHTVLDPHVAELYGVSDLWDGVSPPASLTTGHGGLLTRPAFHVTGTTSTRPIRKGVLIRRRVLCDPLGDPPADLGDLPTLDPASSQRQRTALLTERDGTVCTGCHTRINGLGYVSEDIDSLGRVRSVEEVYGEDGALLASWPVDTRAVTEVDFGDTSVLTGSDELAAALAASRKPEACASRFWFRHTWGRLEDDAVDGCVLQDVEQRLGAGDSLHSALRASALSESFRFRHLDEEGSP